MSEYFYDPLIPAACGKFIEDFCRLSKAPFVGPMRLLQYQRTILDNLYGWWKPGGWIKHKIASIWLPKKNGKSSYCSAIGIWNLLWQPGNEIVIIAPTLKQANCVFEEAAAMVDAHPLLRKRLWCRRNLRRIEDRKYFSKLEVMSCTPEVSGPNCGLCIFDELGEWPKCYAQLVLDRMANSGKVRPFGHKIYISTAQFDRIHPAYTAYTLAKKIQTGEVKDRPDIFPMIFEIGEHENWRDPVLQRKANPASDILFPFSEIEDDYKTLQGSPTEEARFRTLVCNQWVGHSDQWIASDTWAACGSDKLEESTFHRAKPRAVGLNPDDTVPRRGTVSATAPIVIGVDFARKYDLAGYSILIPVNDLVYVFPRFFIPRLLAAKKQRMDNVPYLRDWEGNPRCHLFLTDGNVVNPAEMRRQIAIDCKNFEISEIRFDPYGMEESRQLLEADGHLCTEVTQKPAIMSKAYAHFERMVIGKRIIHPDNPILNWNVGNCKVRQVGTGKEIMLEKRAETSRIDGVTSICIGLTALLAEENNTYDSEVLWI